MEEMDIKKESKGAIHFVDVFVKKDVKEELLLPINVIVNIVLFNLIEN